MQGNPNIVFILIDNLGYGEVGCYGGGLTRGAPTPRIDRLAREGMKLLNFNVEPQCTHLWVMRPITKMITEYQASLKQHPPIKVDTSDPYKPPNRSVEPVTVTADKGLTAGTLV